MKTHKNKENNAYYVYHNPKAYEFMPKEKEFEPPVVINSGFYDELFNKDAWIRYSKEQINEIKEKGIKESIYSNKSVPHNWKTKLTYRDEVSNALLSDTRFAFYLNNNNKLEEEKLKPFITTHHSQFPSLSIETNDARLLQNGTEVNISQKEKKKTTKNYYNTQLLNNQSKQEVESLLDQYRTQFSMKKFIDELKERHKGNLPSNTFQTNSTKTNYFNTLNGKQKNDKEEVFRSSIYVNLIPEDRGKLTFEEQMLVDEKNDLISNAKQTYGAFLNVNTREYNRKITITNPKIKRELELINYYGPRYSHCKLCHNKNLDYYQHNEPNQCLKLLSYLKRTRNRYPIALTEKNAVTKSE